jgi:hypothetical protein
MLPAEKTAASFQGAALALPVIIIVIPDHCI